MTVPIRVFQKGIMVVDHPPFTGVPVTKTSRLRIGHDYRVQLMSSQGCLCIDFMTAPVDLGTVARNRKDYRPWKPFGSADL